MTMNQTVTVEIEARTYSRLQKLARPFEDTPSSVIERLLNSLDGDKALKAFSPQPNLKSSSGTRYYTTARGEKIPLGELRARYKKKGARDAQSFTAHVTDKGIEFNGRVYDNPSPAGINAKKLAGAKGAASSTNGWNFWEWFDPGKRTWVSIDRFRNKNVQPPLTLADL